MGRRSGVSARALRALATALRVTVVGGLLLFHGVLFCLHLVDGRLFEPAVAMRWAMAGVLLAVLIAFRRVGLPLVIGRRAMVVWTLAALLHLNASGPPTSETLSSNLPPNPAHALFLLPVSAAAFAVGAALVLMTLRASTTRRPACRIGRIAPLEDLQPHSTLFDLALPSRAPPRFAC